MTEDNQKLEPSLNKILDGISEFRKATINRIESGDWKQHHLDDLNEISLKLCAYESRLIKLRKENS